MTNEKTKTKITAIAEGLVAPAPSDFCQEERNKETRSLDAYRKAYTETEQWDKTQKNWASWKGILQNGVQ